MVEAQTPETVGDLVDALVQVANEHGRDTPLLTRNVADEGEYGTVEWYTMGRMTVEYDEHKGAVKVE